MFIQADACRLPFADKSVDLVLGSPPYADARTYGIGAQRKCQAWVDWMLDVTAEAVRVCKGLVLWVCAGVTRDHCYWPGPEGLLYEWWKRGGRCWRPAYWHRVGIPGSGGKQWLRADVEYVLAFTGCDDYVPFADNTANGHPPKWAPGGEMSYRKTNGDRKGTLSNPWSRTNGCPSRKANGTRAVGDMRKTQHVGTKKMYARNRDGTRDADEHYAPPVLANPGVAVEVDETAEEILARWIASADEGVNFIKGIKVGGGVMGDKRAHLNEAPFPQKLAEWLIRGWAPAGGFVLDPFSGSGTTVAAAVAIGRRGIGCDLRESQVRLGARRCAEVQPSLLG